MVSGDAGAEKTGGKTYRTDTGVFFPQDVATETVVVDSLGQKLILSIDNVRGGGGQRTISVYSPFWIVNTTEHSLRYKQENTNTFVSGTVSASTRDGSKPLRDGYEREDVEIPTVPLERCDDDHSHVTSGTIFSGTAGALAASPGQCNLAAGELADLIDVDIPLPKLAELAFMFNFNEGSMSLGHQKICVQLWDGTGITRYASDWSQGFSLDSVGFSQVVR
jgi:hypothetical protein